MFKERTLFVVGAGASAEFGLPIGATLIKQIAHSLRFRFEHGQLKEGDYEISSFIRSKFQRNEIDSAFRAGRQISDGVLFSSSIDNYVFQRSDNPEIEKIAKLTILHSILKAEGSSALRTNRNNEDIDFDNIEKTWIRVFFRICFDKVDKQAIAEALQRVTIICFNYDRCIQQFMIYAMARLYSITQEEALDLLQNLTIIHPYGSVGDLHSKTRKSIPFGCSPNSDLLEQFNNIKTFNEQIQDAELITQIKSSVKQARNVVFLGFGFHSQNMEILKEIGNPASKKAFSTSFGLSDPDKIEIDHKVRKSIGLSTAFSIGTGKKCYDFMVDHDLTLSDY